IQCLYNLSDFSNIFISKSYLNYINQNKNFKILLSDSFSLLFSKLAKYSKVLIDPSNFLRTCSILNPHLNIPYDQQDTQEFLMFLLDRTHNELSQSDYIINQYPHLIKPINYFTNISSNNIERLQYDKWFNNLIKNQGVSPINLFFEGKFQSSLKCLICSKISRNFSTFSILSLPIPDINSRSIYIEECFTAFTDDEILTGDNAWACPNCKSLNNDNNTDNNIDNNNNNNSSTTNDNNETKSSIFKFISKREKIKGKTKEKDKDKKKDKKDKRDSIKPTNVKMKAIKSLKFIDLPKLLIIHLSRFSFKHDVIKNNSYINFPLILKLKINDEIISYKLNSFINHDGNLKSGHYTSIIHKKNNWYHCDDWNVYLVRLPINKNGYIKSNLVYVIYYERI
ncbi:ubiquitin-specific protease UBP11, partial [Ascoidea rubescens DSM 1968]